MSVKSNNRIEVVWWDNREYVTAIISTPIGIAEEKSCFCSKWFKSRLIFSINI